MNGSCVTRVIDLKGMRCIHNESQDDTNAFSGIQSTIILTFNI